MRGVVREPALVVIFGILSCGIYTFYWLYKVSEEVQTELGTLGQETSPGMELLFSIISCGLYSIYWIYKYSKLIFEAQQRVNIPGDDNAVLNLILCFVGLSFVSLAIIQSSLNKVWEAK